MLDLINKISDLSYKLFEMANKNLEQLHGKCKDPEETQDYYLGMLRRQAMITYDLHLIMKNRPEENLTTPYILLRTLMDDFIHVIHLDLLDNPDEDILRINASGHKENFNSLKNLTLSDNQVYFGESFGYLTIEGFETLKETFKTKEINKKYFENTEGFKFKKFPTLTEVATSINSTENYNVARDRAFYMWKSFSSFVHYSNWCYAYEFSKNIVNIQQMEEALQYVFNTIHICSMYFKKTKGIECFVDRYIFEEMKFPLLKADAN